MSHRSSHIDSLASEDSASRSILRLTERLAAELVLEKLLHTIVHIGIEQSGARRGLLLLPHPDSPEGPWRMEAESICTSHNQVTPLAPVPHAPAYVPLEFIAFVAAYSHAISTSASAVPATLPGTHPRAALLCLPLRAQHHTLIAILVLESHQADACEAGFTAAQQQRLNLLAAHMALALTNAQRYRALERQMTHQAAELAHLKGAALTSTAILSESNQALQVEINERTRDEALLRQSEHLYRTLVETSPGAILLTDLDGTIEFCNQQAADLFRYAHHADLCGISSINLIASEASHHAYAAMIRNAEEASTMEYIMCRSDGSRFPAEVTSQLVNDQHGQPVSFIILIHDISKHKLLQQRIIENERFAASGRLAASVAHEINTPLQTIQTNLRLLRIFRSDDDESEATSFLSDALEEIKRIGTIVRQLLGLYRPDAATHGHVDVTMLLERIILLLGKRIRDQRITVERDLHPELPYLYSRADELMQVLLNLVVNALDAMPDGGTLRLTTTSSSMQACSTLSHGAHGGQGERKPAAEATSGNGCGTVDDTVLLIQVGDTGCGVAPDMRQKIFEPFMTTKGEGTGLGLFISMQLISQHGGNIIVESEPGQGSTFTVLLPLHPHRNASPPPTEVSALLP